MTGDAPLGSAPLVFAAGGIVARQSDAGTLIAVVHRPRYDDWVLPKGKLDPGERFQDAALREVREETGCDAQLSEFAGVDSYRIEGGIKVVLYWHMTLVAEGRFAPGRETDVLAWLSREEALRRLDHPGEREIVRGK